MCGSQAEPGRDGGQLLLKPYKAQNITAGQALRVNQPKSPFSPGNEEEKGGSTSQASVQELLILLVVDKAHQHSCGPQAAAHRV